MLLVKKSHPNISEIIPPGGTFYRSSFLNRTQVKQNVDKLVKELRMDRTAETKEQRLLHEKQQLKAEKLMDADLEDIELENWNLDNYYHMPQTPKRKNIISSPKQSTVPPILYHKTTKSFSQLRINSVESTISEEMSLELENELSESEHLEDTGPEDDNDEIELESNQESETQNIALTDNLSKKKPKIVFNNKGEIVKKILPSGEIDKKKVKKKKSQKVIPLLPDTFPYFETGYPPAKTDTHTCR